MFGTLFGALTYDLLIYTGDDSIINSSWVLNYPLTGLILITTCTETYEPASNVLVGEHSSGKLSLSTHMMGLGLSSHDVIPDLMT